MRLHAKRIPCCPGGGGGSDGEEGIGPEGSPAPETVHSATGSLTDLKLGPAPDPILQAADLHAVFEVPVGVSVDAVGQPVAVGTLLEIPHPSALAASIASQLGHELDT